MNKVTSTEPTLSHRLQILSTEHWSLLASQSLAWSESFNRATIASRHPVGGSGRSPDLAQYLVMSPYDDRAAMKTIARTTDSVEARFPSPDESA